MDKNNNRTDLIAAGRKKLQQFRKKNNKGNKGNSSKSSKSGNDATAAAAEAPATSRKSNVDSKDAVSSSESIARTDSMSDTVSSTDVLSAEANNSTETASAAVTVEFPPTSDPNADDRHNIDSEVKERDGLLLVLEDENENNHKPGTSDANVSIEQSNDSVASQSVGQHGEEQVTDVGAMQKSDSSNLNQIDKGGGTEIGVHDGLVNESDLTSRDHLASQFPKHDDALPIDIAIREQEAACNSEVTSISNEPVTMPAIIIETNVHQGEDISDRVLNEEKIEVLNVSGVYGAEPAEGTQISSGVIDEACKSEVMSISSEPVTMPAITIETNVHQGEDISARVPNEEKIEVLNVSGVYGAEPADGTQLSSGVIDEEKIDDSKKTLWYKQVDLSSGLDGGLIKLSKLAEILQILNKEEFDFLFSSRGLSAAEFSDADKLNSVSCDAFERLKEHLYVTTFLKDVFHVELSEHQILIDEVSMTDVSLDEVQRMNGTLTEEIEALSTEIKELHHQLEVKQVDISSLSSEIVESRNLIKALQAENERLKESFKLVSEEKKKLFEENGSVLLDYENIKKELVRCKTLIVELQTQEAGLTEKLTSMRDAMTRLEEENDHIVRDNSKLLGDVEEYKSEVETFKAENINLNETFTSVSKDRKNLEGKIELVVNQNEKLSNELIECKKLVSTLEMEISELNENLKSIMVEREKAEKEKMDIFVEYEKQSQVLAEIKISEAGLQAECTKVVNDLKEGTFRINQLVEENETLKRNLGFNIEVVEANSSGISETLSREILKQDVYDEKLGFVALKMQLEEAGTVMQRLENAVESMHSHFNSLRMSNDKIAPGVSRLIQAFESKGNADDNETEEPPTENQTIEDPYRTTTMVVKDLRALLIDIVMDAENASGFCKGMMQSKLLAESSEAELRSKYESLKEHSDQAEELNIELMILYETIRENSCQAGEREDELRILFHAFQKQEMVLKSQNIDLTEKLTEFEIIVNGLERKLKETCKDSEEMVASLSEQVKILEEERNSIVAQVLQSVDELYAAVETFQSNSLFGTSDNHDIITRVASSISSATKVIEDLKKELETTRTDRQSLSDVCNEMLEKTSNLQVKNDMASNTLYELYNDLSGLVSKTDNVLVGDLTHMDSFKPLIDHLKRFHGEKLELESANKQLNSELTNNATDMDNLRKECLKVDSVMKLVEDIEQSLRKDSIEIHAIEPAFRIEYLVSLLFDKYKEAVQSLSLSTSQDMQLTELQEQVERLNLTHVQYENENLVFKQSLKSAEQDAASLNTKLQEKVAELEQSEQRVASLREKLSIAVTKGKGLISQRDSLKHTLAETSQELLSKDARINELESKLEVYAEAGERMEALESELSYIRNSATALRESFLLKDSVLQRVEEILEDLDLPEHLYSGDIIEKVDWLAKSVTGNSLPSNEWDRRSSAGVDSHSDAGIAGVDTVMEEAKPNPNSTEDLRPNYEELQRKFYELAEQNEMLEQSLMERSNLVRRWEEILDRIELPSSLRLLEPEEKIQWLENALSDALNQSSSLQQKIDSLESFCGSLTADLEDSQRSVSEFDSVLQQALMDKETLSRDLEIMRKSDDENSRKAADFVIGNENLQNEIYLLQEQKRKMEEGVSHTEATIRRLQELVIDAFKDFSTEDVVLDQGVNYLEELLSNLVEKYKSLSSEKPADIAPVDVSTSEESKRSLRKELDDCMDKLTYLKEEKDRYAVNNQSLVHEIEALNVTKNELQQLLSQEEQKSASVREKLNVAVRKGKSLVQQRDGMKQAIEQLTAEVERLKSENKRTEITISDNEQRIKDLLSSHEKARVMESENVLLKEHLVEKEHSITNLRVNLDSSEQESRKSKRAAELLLAELNEVQERNDVLQEELAKVDHMLSEVSRGKDLAESAKYEALARVEELYMQFEEKDRQLSELTVLKSGVDQTRQEIIAAERELGDVLTQDLEVLHYVGDLMKSFMESGGEFELSAPLPRGFDGSFKPVKSENKVFATEIACLKERLYDHSLSLHEETLRLSEVFRNVHTEYSSQKESRESMNREVTRLQSAEKERESELHVLRANISLINETYTSIFLEIENWMKDALPSNFPERYVKSQTLIEDLKYSINDISFFTEERIRGMRDKLLFVVKDFINMRSELTEDGQREMKSTILNLQNELQEKDIQRERVCAELVSQIKEAENTAKNYLQELQQTRGALKELNSKITVMKEEHGTLEQRMKELKDKETNSTGLHQKISSLADALAAKEQENESLLQALDEEESQMEELTNKIGTLEHELQQKNQELENTEASRSKALKKLSVAVNKFDELHCLSENLLSEVEKLQSQLQERDGEISFLRQEVTRCTNDALAITQMNKKRNIDEVHDVLKWLGTLISRVNTQDLTFDYKESQEVSECKEMLQKQIMSLVSELENLRSVAHSSNTLLQQERTKVEELEQKEQIFKYSLREKESQILVLQRAGDFIEPANSTSEIVELEPMKNNWAPPGNTAQQVRSLRKTNNDQVAIAIDMDQNSDRLEDDDDDDKAHGFKSLTTSKIVPRFTRPISDMVDGLWVSCDRALMRQPALRLGVILYWAVLHAFLAAFVV